MKQTLKLHIERQLRKHVAKLRVQYNVSTESRQRESIRVMIEDLDYERFRNERKLPAEDFNEPVLVLNSGKEKISFGWDDHFERLITIRVPRGMDGVGVREFARYALSRSCNHSFDCCGCYQTAAYFFRQVSKREFIVRVSSYRNI